MYLELNFNVGYALESTLRAILYVIAVQLLLFCEFN